jgi:hypothetical protein
MSRPINTRCTAAAALVAAALLALAPSAWADPPHGGNPPGNNGTIKVDGVEFDQHPNNEPHPGCVFEIDFYGFDEGTSADLEFRAHPPTGTELILEDTVDLGDTNASGGGSEAGFDVSSAQYDLGTDGLLDDFEPHPQQGYHIKLTIHAEGSQGADTKHKVFWVECAPEVAEVADVAEVEEEEEELEELEVRRQAAVDEAPSGVLAEEVVAPPPAEVEVLGAGVTAAPAAAPAELARVAPQVAGVQLARTGGPLDLLLVVAGLVLVVGGTLVSVGDGRRRRPA